MRKLIGLCVIGLVAVVLAWFTEPSQGGEKKTSKPVSLREIAPFNGHHLQNWKVKGDPKRSKWVVGTRTYLDVMDPRKLTTMERDPARGGGGGDAANQLINKESGGIDIYSETKFGDCIIDLELMVPQGSNSGIYVMGEYEVQILDSYGRAKVGAGDLGGLYGASAPRVNASLPPGEWQRMIIDFTAPRFVDGKKVSSARFNRVVLNDQIIHENVEMKGPTPSGVTGKEAPTGPIMFQGDHGPVAFRNIRILTW